jgi:hypothetical protein
MSFESSSEVFDWLGKFVNLEQGAQPPMRGIQRLPAAMI